MSEAAFSLFSVAFTAFGAYSVVELGNRSGNDATAELILFSILGYGSLCVAYQYAYESEEAHADLMKLVTGTVGYTIGTMGWPLLRASLSK